MRSAERLSAEQEFDPCQPWEESEAEPSLPGASYRGLHFCYSLVAVALLATGLLIHLPDLRAWTVGGYGRTIASLHEWGGVVMLVLPAIALLMGPKAASETMWIRSYRRANLRLHSINLWFTLVSGVIFIVSGFILWFLRYFPDVVVDVSVELHVIFTYALMVVVPLHIVVSRERLALNLRTWLSAKTVTPSREPRLTESKDPREDLAC